VICALVGIGTEIAKAKSIAPKSSLFILLPPSSGKRIFLKFIFDNDPMAAEIDDDYEPRDDGDPPQLPFYPLLLGIN
jgi:hypothetical protein